MGLTEGPTEADLARMARRFRFLYVEIAKLRQKRHTTDVRVRMHPDDEPLVTSIGGIPVTRHRTIPPGEAWVIDHARTPWDRVRAPIAAE